MDNLGLLCVSSHESREELLHAVLCVLEDVGGVCQVHLDHDQPLLTLRNA